MRTAAVLAIGDELTCGYRLDTHSQTISRKLGTVPLETVLHLTIGDNLPAIEKGLQAALDQVDVVIITGGLGPTEDDLTRQAVSGLLHRPLIEDSLALSHIQERFARRKRSMPERNRIQAQVPDGSEIIYNDRGTAAGFHLQLDGKHLFAIPGVPYEMIGMLETFILPKLRDWVGTGQYLQQAVVKLFGPAESEVAERIQHMLSRDRNPLLGLLPQRGTITIEMVARGASLEEAQALLAADRTVLQAIFGRSVLCLDERTLPQVVGDLLAKQGLTLAVAEAAGGTGGMIAARLTGTTGYKEWFQQGIVMEAPSTPQEVQTLAAETKQTTQTDIGLATGTLLFPPDAPPTRPYGTMVTAISLRDTISWRNFSYSGVRERVRDLVTEASLGLLRANILDQ